MTAVATDWFSLAKFGLFIHWGMYALWGRGEQVLLREHLAPSAYRQRATEFDPRRYDPSVWAELAHCAGMRYAVLTARHHDGYCLFDSAASAFTAVHTGPKRDLVAEYVRAFRQAGLRVGLYYSLADWQWPAYWQGPQRDPDGFATYVDYVHTQVRELCSQYGLIDIFWFDGAWPHSAADWRSVELLETIAACSRERW